MLQGVSGHVGIVGDDQRHGLAHVADDVAGDGRLQVAVGAGRGGHTIGDDGGGRDVGGGQDGVNAGHVAGALRVDRDQPRVGVGRAQHGRVEHAGHAHVVDEPAGAGHEPLSPQPGMRLADHAGLYAGAARAIGNDGLMRILLVDDSSPHRRLLTMLFNRSGHEALTAADGAAALEILEREKDIDAVVSDVRMPKIDGFQLCRTIRNDARWAKLPFIFYSSIFIGDPAKTFGRDLGATAYLDAKDIAPGEVAKELERLVNQHVRAEYDETLGRLLDDVEFARRYHNVVLASLGGAAPRMSATW